jgi:hypothetical protein
MAALDAALRDEVIPSLPAAALIVMAGRPAPDGRWFQDGWEHLARDVRLRPLTDDEATERVAIPVTDQDRTKGLLETLGLECRYDALLQPGFRWIEMVPPGAATSIALVATGPGLPVGIDTGIRLLTPDARAAHATLSDLGFSVGELLEWETAPLMFSFLDLDGNRFYVTQSS